MTDKKDDELAGFRDFIEGENIKRPSSKGAQNKHAGFELLSFLELESARLDKQLSVMEEKSYILKSCDNFDNLNKNINREISLRNNELMLELFRPGSPMMKSLEDLFKNLEKS